MSFIRGIFALCASCTQELSLRSDVLRVAKSGPGVYMYYSRCPSCHVTAQTVVEREVHVAGVAYLRQVVANQDAAETIVEAVNVEEMELLDFHDFLETATEDTIWAELHASS